ncbi:ATP-binding protein [Actinomadura sp. WMMB 499]|uniref:ATP-binding protein n=1 Tax=Actinomadura sp. WMMB 499 TaxID=1219491 RepID=UPI001244DB91|nr:ATP-binding protein [Actinomadura sp. WMMB 499]QFG23325.1 ATP-binding protein [Actinomadura sp. WMMB 499]
MELVLRLCLPRDAETVHVTRGVLGAALGALGVTASTREDIGLALGEACANVIQHADPGDEYEIQVRATEHLCEIEVTDMGRGFDVTILDRAGAGAPVTAEHGRGLQIIEALADKLVLANRGESGAVLRFEKALTWDPGTAKDFLTGRR